METFMLKTSATRSFTKKALLFLLVAVMAVSTVNAGVTDSNPGDETTTVYCLRVEKDQLFFVVTHANVTGEKFDILVNDASGENLYRGTFAGKDFSKVFRAPADNGKLVVIIRTRKVKDDQKFEIKAEEKIISETYVKRM
jgi:hypothetical protein